MRTVVPVILCGGIGSRLWPLSRQAYPKQLLNFTGDHSLLQNTVLRAQRFSKTPPLVVCNAQYRFLIAEQLRIIGAEAPTILVEPVARNTAPAIAIAAHCALDLYGEQDPILLVLPADHLIQDQDAFLQAATAAATLAAEDLFVTFGVIPDRPETGYGYIKRGEKIASTGYKIAAFVEKPKLATAEQYIREGNYYWNSGMFLLPAKKYISELNVFEMDMAVACEKAYSGAQAAGAFLTVDAHYFSKAPCKSVDYAVMERTQDAAMVTFDAGWSDVGSWQALKELSPKDEQGNVLQGDVIAEAVEHSFIWAQNRLVAALGVRGQVIIETEEAVLVSDEQHLPQMRVLLEKLQRHARSGLAHPSIIYHPWGSCRHLSTNAHFQVHLLQINSQGTMPTLQPLPLGHQAVEYWVVVRGTGAWVNEHSGERLVLTQGQWFTVPPKIPYHLENKETFPLEIVQLQVLLGAVLDSVSAEAKIYASNSAP